MRSFVYTISFLLSFFLTLSIYILIHLKPTVEKFNVESQQAPATPNMQTVIPAYADNFLSFTSFISPETKIDLSQKRWYDNDTTTYYLRYTGEKNISLIDDAKKNVKTANVKEIELIGPNAFQFANTPPVGADNPYELSAFTFLLMAKVVRPTAPQQQPPGTPKNTLFELLCNTLSSVDTSTSHPTYSSQVISINLELLDANNTNFEVRIGSDNDATKKSYLIQNSALYTADSPVLISLSYNKFANANTGTVRLKVGEVTKTFDIQNPVKITLGSAPFILNKGGEIDINVYSMAFYKKALTDTEIDQYKNFNEYYINGINKIVDQSKTAASQLTTANEKLKNVEASLSSCQKTVATVTSSSQTASSQTSSSSMEPNKMLSMPRVDKLQLEYDDVYKDYYW